MQSNSSMKVFQITGNLLKMHQTLSSFLIKWVPLNLLISAYVNMETTLRMKSLANRLLISFLPKNIKK